MKKECSPRVHAAFKLSPWVRDKSYTAKCLRLYSTSAEGLFTKHKKNLQKQNSLKKNMMTAIFYRLIRIAVRIYSIDLLVKRFISLLKVFDVVTSKTLTHLLYEVAIVLEAGNILSVLLFRQSTKFLPIKHTSCMLCPKYSTLGNASSRLPREFNFRECV